jgi:hypothetical protein
MVHILGCNNLNVVARTAWSTDKVQEQCCIVSWWVPLCTCDVARPSVHTSSDFLRGVIHV